VKKKLVVFASLLFISSPAPAQDSFLWKISPFAFDEGGNIDPLFTSLLCSYNALNINDVFLTRKILDKGGYEANPLMKWTANNRPYELILKSVLMLGENFTLKWLKKENEFFAYGAAILLNVLYTYVNYNNYRVLFMLNKEL
jgi:hypothetical protein